MILVILLAQLNRHIIYNTILAKVMDETFYSLCILSLNIILGDYIFYLFQTLFNKYRVITGTILTKKIFQNVCRYRKVPFYEESQILTDNLTNEGFHYFFLKFLFHFF